MTRRGSRLGTPAEARALAVASGRLAVAAARRIRRKHKHDSMAVGRYVHQPGVTPFAVRPMPQTVRYSYCECGALTAEILPGDVPLMALMGFSTSEFQKAFRDWTAEAGQETAGA